MNDFYYQSASMLAEAIRCKDISSYELVTAYLAHIAKVNPQINAIVQLDAERALARAKELDQLLAKGFLLGPLHGVPFTAKDIYNTEGIITTLGTLGLKNHIPDHDATIIQRVKAAGGILLGKTNISELCTAAETDNLVYGHTRNPYSLEHSAGGSSGGEAAAIAAACSAFGLGSDLAGSLRIPAHCCGITALRPSVGRVPCSLDFKGSGRSGIRTGIEAELIVDGPMARYVEDLFLVLKVIAGADGQDPKAVDVPLRDPQEIAIEALDIAYFTEADTFAVSPAIQAAITNAAQALNEIGALVRYESPRFLAPTMELLLDLAVASHRAQATEATLMMMGTKQLSAQLQQYLNKVRRKGDIHADLQATWSLWSEYQARIVEYCYPYDAILCPVMPFTAPHGSVSLWDDYYFPTLSYCVAFSLAQCPAVTVSIGQDQDGMPIGIQIVTKPWQEDVALAIAAYLEQYFGGWEPPALLSNTE